MTQAGITILPWAEYMVPQRRNNLGPNHSNYGSLLAAGIDLDNVLSLSPEADVLKDMLQTDRYGQILRVNTLDDLQELSALLFGKHLLMRITLIHTEVASKYSADKVSIWEGDFACFINTSHPKVKQQFEWAIKEARNHLTSGTSFSIEIDVGDLLEGWYLQNIDLFSGCDDFQTTKTKRSLLILTNHVPINHCFDCKPKWWLCFGPCWLMSAPCYYMYRRMTCTDIRIKLNAPVSSLHGIRRKSISSDVSQNVLIVNYKADGHVSCKLKGDNSQMSDLSTYGSV